MRVGPRKLGTPLDDDQLRRIIGGQGGTSTDEEVADAQLGDPPELAIAPGGNDNER
jgi:hypothetical protein